MKQYLKVKLDIVKSCDSLAKIDMKQFEMGEGEGRYRCDSLAKIDMKQFIKESPAYLNVVIPFRKLI